MKYFTKPLSLTSNEFIGYLKREKKITRRKNVNRSKDVEDKFNHDDVSDGNGVSAERTHHIGAS